MKQDTNNIQSRHSVAIDVLKDCEKAIERMTTGNSYDWLLDKITIILDKEAVLTLNRNRNQNESTM